MKDSELYARFKRAIDHEANGWRGCDRLTELEKREKAQNMIYGIVTAALFVLPENYYHDLVTYIHEQGFNH